MSEKTTYRLQLFAFAYHPSSIREKEALEGANRMSRANKQHRTTQIRSPSLLCTCTTVYNPDVYNWQTELNSPATELRSTFTNRCIVVFLEVHNEVVSIRLLRSLFDVSASRTWRPISYIVCNCICGTIGERMPLVRLVLLHRVYQHFGNVKPDAPLNKVGSCPTYPI